MIVDFGQYMDNNLHYINENNLANHSPYNQGVFLTLDIANMIGWKYHPDQAQPKKRGSAEINLKDLTADVLNENPEEEIKFGKISLKQGLEPGEEEYDIVEETERLKKIIREKIGEEKLEEKMKMIKKSNSKKDSNDEEKTN
jgi:hypothetical protein